MGDVQTQYFPLVGGEDRVTSPLTVSPGRLRLSQNYDCNFDGGYRRISGYERFDGRPAPNDATFFGQVVRYTPITGFPTLDWAAGDVITGMTSGATGVLFAISTNNAVGYGEGGYGEGGYGGGLLDYVWTTFNFTGTFIQGETLTNGTQTAVAITSLIEKLAANDDDFLATLAGAQEARRVLITTVPGAGPVRGVFTLKGNVYAFRDDSITAPASTYVWRATASGWQLVPYGTYLAFLMGTYEVERNDTITGATSGATAKVSAFMVASGSPADGDAAGRLYLKEQVGTFTAGEQLFIGPELAATAGTVTAILPPHPEDLVGGSEVYETVRNNFFADADSDAVYGVNGYGKAFAFDGAQYIEILTGNTDDRPTHIAAHRDHLFLSFRGGSLQASSDGNPYDWRAINGAAEFGAGSEITNIISSIEVLTVLCADRISQLYGATIYDWVLKPYSSDVGGFARTAQNMGRSYFLDARGIIALDAVRDFGNFASAAISTDIQPRLRDQIPDALTTLVVRGRNLYRLLFKDGTGWTAAFRANELVGFTQFRLHEDHPPSCTHTGSTSTLGDERVFFGSTNGFVYEMERDTPERSSFDGQDIQAFFRVHFNHLKSPRVRKRYRKAVFELDAPVHGEIIFDADFGYATQDTPELERTDIAVKGGGAFWGTRNWSEFVWSEQAVSEAEARIDGTGTNVSFLISSTGQEPPHIFHGVVLHFTPRRLQR